MTKPYVTGAAGACPAQLRQWFQGRRRELPWRVSAGADGLRDPYRTWVAEIMLQQTRVEAVVPYFEAFLARFPTVEALAAAEEDQVLAAWAGLGYYRRARHLQAAAKAVAAVGAFPTTAQEWQELPGIGPYTSAAIASLVSGERLPVVDGNVKRVVARLDGLELRRDDPALHRASEQAGSVWMTQLPPAQLAAAGELNEALMELGATVCKARQALCEECPWQSSCTASQQGDPHAYPLPPRKKEVVARRLQCLMIGAGEQWQVSQRQSGWNPGFYEPPLMQSGEEREQFEAAHALRPGRRLGEFAHAITNHRFRIEVWHYPQEEGVATEAIADLALTTITRKALAIVQESI